MTTAGPITVLITDDFERFRQFVRSKLQGNKFQVVAEVSDGLEAATKAAELRPDIVLLDIAMPNLNGIEAAARIRAAAPKSKIIFISQNADAAIVQTALSNGAHGYLHKPKTPGHLLPAIDAMLGGETFVIIM